MRRVVVLVAAVILGVACGLAAVAVSASLRAVIGAWLGIPAAAGGYSQQAELAGSGTVQGGYASAVALSAGGSTALVGTHVFTRRGGTWSQTGELTVSGMVAEDYYGGSVALSAGGGTALVGAYGRQDDAGAVYVFTLRGGTWAQTAELTDPNAVAHDQFGWSVALSPGGGTALVGATGMGAVYVFTLRGGTWAQTAELTASDAASEGFFGTSVSLSAGGGTALVGATGKFNQTWAGYVFTLRDGTWTQTAKLTASYSAAGDQTPTSEALSAGGSTALVGATEHQDDAGAVYVFTLRGGTWTQTAELTASDAAPSSEFGDSVALSAGGGTALVGAYGRHNMAGAVYVFTLRGGTWTQTAELTGSDTAPGWQFGGSVALSAPGGTALVGATDHNFYTGAVYMLTPGGGA